MNPANKIIFNTSILYIRLLIGLVIGLFTTRMVLGALGTTDYGIYALVAGVVGMLGILNNSMSNASMRFMAHSLGTGNDLTIRKTFNTTLFLHFVIGLIVVFIMEAGGILMFKYLLNIPIAKIADARIVFHFMVVTSFVSIISVPYDAVINSHENILALSLVDLLGNIMTFGVAIYITYSKMNLLILYGFLLLLVQITLRIIKQWYSLSTYKECKINFRKYVDKTLSKTILSFSGWNLFGSIASMSVTQIKSIFLNIYFGVKVNAADGISSTVSGQVNMISVSLTRALNPQLVKSEGSGDRLKMLRFTEMSTKFSVFLFSVFAIPVILETPYLLHLWLKTVPEYAIIFCQLVLISLFLEKFTFEIGTAIRAVGNIRNFQIAEAMVWILNIPFYYLVLNMGYPPYSVFGVSIIISVLGACVRLYFGKKMAGMKIKSFFQNGILPISIPVILSFSITLVPRLYLSESFSRLFISTISSLLVMITTFIYLGLTKNEGNILKQLAHSLVQRVYIFKNK